MNDLEPIAVVLKFGFLVVLFAFLFWVARVSLRDIRLTAGPGLDTGYHDAQGGGADRSEAWLVVVEGGGLDRGERYDLFGGLTLGRSGSADIQLDDNYASGIHARIFARRGGWIVEDMGSTNGTLLNGEDLEGQAEVRDGDLISIGDTELRVELG